MANARKLAARLYRRRREAAAPVTAARTIDYPTLALLTNLPAPYRIPVWNHLARLVGGALQVRFTGMDERLRNWTVPGEETHFQWKFLVSHAGASRLFSELRAGAAMLGFLLSSRPKSVICGGYDNFAAWLSFVWCKVTGRRFVLWLEATTRDHHSPSALKGWLKRLIVSRADAIAASGKATVEYVKRLGAREDRVFIAPFGGDVDGFAQEAARAEAAPEFPHPTAFGGHAQPMGEGKDLHFRPPLVLYSGRLVREKGVFVLLEAFRQIAAELPEVGLLIVGDGPDRKAMEDFCRSSALARVYFARAQEYNHMPRFYALADVLALPTFSDQWGFVVNEAFACGVPAVVSRVAGACEDLIREGETGFMVEPGDAGDLAAKLLRVLRDEPLRLRMSANCRRLIRHYSAEACAEGLLAAAQAREKRHVAGPPTFNAETPRHQGAQA